MDNSVIYILWQTTIMSLKSCIDYKINPDLIILQFIFDSLVDVNKLDTVSMDKDLAIWGNFHLHLNNRLYKNKCTVICISQC